MAKKTRTQRKKRFQFKTLRDGEKGKLELNDEGEDVFVLQAILTQMGYLGRGRDPGRMCPCTCDAVQYFQKCYGLDATGETDRDTLELLQRPRCGVPDLPADPAHGSGPAPFVIRDPNCRYHDTNLTYAFINSTPDLLVERQREIVREAFAAWSDVTPLRFAEVAPIESPTFEVSFERGDHGDGAPFDDAGSVRGNTLAHAFYPPPCGGRFSGSLHFDEFELWTDQAASSSIRLLNVAIHEIGHLLGLDHSNVRDAIMFAFYDDDLDSLRPDDTRGIQTLYGRPPRGAAPIRGELTGAGDRQVHQITAPTGRMTVTLQGPPGVDFDLYVRAGLAPTRTEFDARGFSPTPRERVVLDVSGGVIFVAADSWRGSGQYEIGIEFS